MKPNIVDFDAFASKYMAKSDQPFLPGNGPIQIYPLHLAATFINAPTPLFRADYNFILLFSSGGGEQQVDYDLFKLVENDVLFIREGHLNAITEISPNTEGYYIHINSFVLDQVFPNKALLAKFSFSPKNSISDSDMKWLGHCCELILSQLQIKGSLEIEISLLRAMVLKLAESWQISSKTTDRQSEITMLFKELLYVNFREQRNVDFYAETLSISENYLNRSVKLITNKPPKQHINELVINHAKLLLRDQGKDISQIAFELNFSDPSYFGRLFKQITNKTPSEYRKAIWQDLSE